MVHVSGGRKKKAAGLDFENLPPIPEGAFTKATRRSQICLAKLTPKDTLLPPDVHYEVRLRAAARSASFPRKTCNPCLAVTSIQLPGHLFCFAAKLSASHRKACIRSQSAVTGDFVGHRVVALDKA